MSKTRIHREKNRFLRAWDRLEAALGNAIMDSLLLGFIGLMLWQLATLWFWAGSPQ